MAVAYEEFSIREFTAKMRAVDVGKCWPFSDDSGKENGMDDEEQLESLLPPITITKFRWWSNELNKIQQREELVQVVGISRNEAEYKEEEVEEEEKLEIVCPVCGNFAAASMKAMNAHVNSCLAHSEREDRRKMRMTMKAKSKSPKKRSIVEIFAVSPQIGMLDDDDDDDNDNDNDDNDGEEDEFCYRQEDVELKKKKIKINNKKKINKVPIAKMLTTEKKNNKKLKKKKMKKKKNKGSIANKGSARKLKLPIPANCSRKVNGSFHNKGITKDILDNVSIHRNKSALKGSITKKRGVQASKFIAKHQKAVIPVRGILKNHTKLIPQQNSEIFNLPSGSQTNCCEFQHSDRHVRFSGKDDILGPRKNSFSSLEPNIFDTHADVLTSESEQDHSTGSDKESPAVMVNRINDVSVSTGNGTELETMTNKKQLAGIHDHVAMPDFLRPHREKEQHITDRSSPSQVSIHDNNFHLLAQGYQTAPHNPTYAGILRLLPTVNEAYSPHVNSQLCGNASVACDSRGKSIDYFEDHIHGFPARDSLTSTRAFTQPSWPDFASIDSGNRRISFMPQTSIRSITDQALQYQPHCHLSPVEFIGPEWKQRVGSISDRNMDEEHCGLPLNSHGELIQASSSSRVGFKQLKKSPLVSSSSSSSPHNSVLTRSIGDFASENHPIEQAVLEGQLNFLPIQKNHNVNLPARFGVTELPNTERLDDHLLNSERRSNNRGYPLHSNPSLTNLSLNQWRQYGQSQNQNQTQMTRLKENSANISLKTAQPIMRLMGKDVAIGRSNMEMQEFEDGNIWMDKEIIQEHHPTSHVLGNSLLKRHIQQDRTLFPAPGKSNETLPDPLEIEQNQASQSNFWMKVPESRLPHPYFDLKTNAAFQNIDLAVNRNAMFQSHPSVHPSSPFDMLYKEANLQESLVSGAETVSISSQLPILSTSQDTLPYMDCRPEINYQQNLPHARRSAFDFPFLYPDCREHIPSSSFPSSSRNLPPWLLHATVQVKNATMPSLSFSDVGSKHHHYTANETKFLSARHHSSVVSHPHSSMVSNPHPKSSLGSALFVQPPVFPFSSETNPISSMNTSSGNKINVGNRIKSNHFCVKVPDHYQKIKKRPATMADDLLQPTKMPSLIPEDSSVVIELTREKSSIEIWHNEPSSNGDKKIDVGHVPNEAYKDGTSNDIDSCKADGMVKSGPIKLTAGAKHILKPRRNMDQDNNRLIHSTIPFAAVTDCDNVLDSQKKSTMIYRF